MTCSTTQLSALNFRIHTLNHNTILSLNNSSSSINGQVKSLKKGEGLRFRGVAMNVWEEKHPDFWADETQVKGLGLDLRDVSSRVEGGRQRQHTQPKRWWESCRLCSGTSHHLPRSGPVHAAIHLRWRNMASTRLTSLLSTPVWPPCGSFPAKLPKFLKVHNGACPGHLWVSGDRKSHLYPWKSIKITRSLSWHFIIFFFFWKSIRVAKYKP